MRASLTAIAAAAIVAVAAASPAQAAGELTGKMAMYNYLVGSWNCSDKSTVMGKTYTGPSTVTVEVVPNNAFHDHVSAANYSGDDYFGYDDQGGTFWNSSAGNWGDRSWASSKDGVTYTGTSWRGASPGMNSVSVYTKAGDGKFTLHSVTTGGGHTITSDIDCTK